MTAKEGRAMFVTSAYVSRVLKLTAAEIPL
jgi:hypothetical protein